MYCILYMRINIHAAWVCLCDPLLGVRCLCDVFVMLCVWLINDVCLMYGRCVFGRPDPQRPLHGRTAWCTHTLLVNTWAASPCVCVCVCVCLHACTHAFVCALALVCLCVCVCECICACVCVSVYECVYMFMRACACSCACVWLRFNTYIYIYIYMY